MSKIRLNLYGPKNCFDDMEPWPFEIAGMDIQSDIPFGRYTQDSNNEKKRRVILSDAQAARLGAISLSPKKIDKDFNSCNHIDKWRGYKHFVTGIVRPISKMNLDELLLPSTSHRLALLQHEIWEFRHSLPEVSREIVVQQSTTPTIWTSILGLRQSNNLAGQQLFVDHEKTGDNFLVAIDENVRRLAEFTLQMIITDQVAA